MQVEFRELTNQDIDACLSIMKQNYTKEHEEFWVNVFKRDFSDMLNKLYPSKCLVVLLGGIIIGFGCWVKSSEATAIPYKLTWLNIIPKEQGKGIGKKLVKELERDIKKQLAVGYLQPNKINFSVVLETDKPYFYKKLGYITYNKNGNNVLMQKNF